MHRIDTNENPEDNVFHDGDSSTETPALGTIVDAAWLNAVQGEISIFIEAMGITLQKGNDTQLKEAVKNAVNPVIHAVNGIIDYLKISDQIPKPTPIDEPEAEDNTNE